ncbi:hypothetical protein FRC17_000064, partial [Serendipita sp. 399]
MSVDSFIQSRVSVDTTSDHSSTPHGHMHSQLRSNDPAIDPRWGMVLQNPAAEHAFFESIAGELSETDRAALNASSPGSAKQTMHQHGGSIPSRALSDAEDGQSSIGTRRHSMLRTKIKHGRNFTPLNRPQQQPPPPASGGFPAPNDPSHQPGDSVSFSSGGTRTTSDTRAGSLSSIPHDSVPTAATRRPAVSSSGVPPLPIPTSTLPRAPQPTSLESHRVNAQGPTMASRTRTFSLGGPASSSSAAAAASATGHPPTAPSLRLATGDVQVQSSEEPDYCIAVVGAKGCGKSALTRKIVKSFQSPRSAQIQVGEHTVPSIIFYVNFPSALKPIRILEVDSAIVSSETVWPAQLPRIDGVLLCYDASDEASFTRIPELVAGYHALGHALIILACKSDLRKLVSPRKGDACGKPYQVGLVEVSVMTESGKQRLRDCFNWEIKAIGRYRRAGKHSLSYKNPASPDLLNGPRPPWEGSNPLIATGATSTHPLPNSSSVGSIAGRHSNNSAPVLPLLDTYVASSAHTSIHSTPPTVPSTARTSLDSLLVSSSNTPLSTTPPRRRSPSLPTTSPARTRSASDLMAGKAGTGSGLAVDTATSTSATASSNVTSTDAPLPRTASTSSIQQVLSTPPQGHASSQRHDPPSQKGVNVTNSGAAAASDTVRNQRESTSLQWATLDEILDKLLFVSVSGDDPLFIQHFFLTYRRFASPRSVLLGMQKRMRQLSQETRDPLLAKFAQMRICNLLLQWKENYPTDFGAPGTFGALSALLKQIVSNVHLVHYASDLLPFLEEVPKLTDRETFWSKKEEIVGDDSDDEGEATDEEIIPQLEDDDDTYVGKGKAFEKRPPTSSNPSAPPHQTVGERPYPPKASSSAPNVSTVPPPLPPPAASFQSRLPSGSISRDATEKVITADRVVGKSAKVNTKELRKVSNAIQEIETVHIAQEVTRRMLILFRKIEARDWLRRTLSTKEYDKEADSIGQLGHLFNYLCCWVSTMIIVFDTTAQRARIVEKLIAVAKALRQLNNYMGMKAVVAGINSVRGNDDEQLTQHMASKSNSNFKQFKSLHVLLGSRGMGQTYRLALKHTVGPAIPDLERHGSDLIRTNEANLDYHPQDPSLIHWGKFTIIGKLVGTITLYQNRCFTMPDYRDLEERSHISDLVFNQVVWDYDTLMNREAKALEGGVPAEPSGIRKVLTSLRGTFNALERQRLDILSSIAQKGIEHHGKLDAVKIRHNEIVREGWEMKRGIFDDPLVHLPKDVWEGILRHLVAESDQIHEMNDLFNALCVSKLWETHLLATPQIWTTIIVDEHGEDELAKIATCLELSNPAQIDLVVRFPHSAWSEVAQLLRPHSHRIRTIDWVHIFGLNPEKRWIEDVMLSLKSLPALNCIYTRSLVRVSPRDTMIEMAPNLVNMSCLLIDSNETSGFASRAITHIAIKFSPATNLFRMPKAWSRLTHLNLLGNNNNILKVPDNYHGNLVYLTVPNVSASDFVKFLSCLPNHSLQYLTFNLTFEYGFEDFKSVPKLGPLVVQSVIITLRGQGPHEAETAWALSTITETMPLIKAMKLSWFYLIHSTTLISLERLPYLRSLALKGAFLPSIAGSSPSFLPTLHMLVDST